MSVPSEIGGEGLVESARIRLRPLAPANILALIEGVDIFTERFGVRPAEGLREFYVSGDVSPLWLEQLRVANGTDPWTFGFAIIDKASNTVVGSGGFKGAPDVKGVVEIAYGIVPAYEGKGYASEVTAELVAFAFRDSRVRKVCAHTLPENNASARVLIKNRFLKVGEVEDPEDGLVWRWERARESSSAQ